MELLPHDVVEYILERLDAKTLLKFTAVSKQWKSSIIQCRSFQTRQMLHRKQSGKTDVVLVSLYDGSGSNPNIEALRTLVVGSTVSVKIPTSWENKFYQGDETNILALDLHNETFQVIPRPPFLHSLLLLIESIICSIHDRLCVSERIWPEQVIWSFDSEDKTWKKIYSIDLKTTPYWRRNNIWRTFTPLSVLGKDKLLFYDGESSDGPLVTLDLKTKYYDIAYKCNFKAYKALCYVPSLISIL
ncbi:unnamed protein product [Brassica oleracea]